MRTCLFRMSLSSYQEKMDNSVSGKLNFWMKTSDGSAHLSDFAVNLLKKCSNLNKPEAGISIEEFMRKSDEFPIEFGTDTCRIKSQPKDRHPAIERKQICSAYPVIHERVLTLYLAFLEHKMNYGTPIEKKIYENVTLTGFVQRLLTKRCVSFLGFWDYYLLLDGKESYGGFESVGTSKEKSPLTMANVLSYDEMKLSAFLSASTYTDFINDGTRQNMGRIEIDKSKFTQEGLVIGLIGPRFQRPDVMDCEDMLITKNQNTTSKGYAHHYLSWFDGKAQDLRRVWNEFYEESSLLYSNVNKTVDAERFHPYRNRNFDKDILYFDLRVLRKRYTVSFDTLLLEADYRAATEKRLAYLHVVGIGLGVWKAINCQEQIFVDTFIERLKMFLAAGKLNHIAAVDFSYVSKQNLLTGDNAFLQSETHPNGGIKVLLSTRNFAEKLPTEFEDALLIVSFAWDSNSLPGNEFWLKCLGNSSDSTTASNSLITELMNPHINTQYVNGENLHIATADYGVLHLKDYCQRILKLF